jgi:hypothetical protein
VSIAKRRARINARRGAIACNRSRSCGGALHRRGGAVAVAIIIRQPVATSNLPSGGAVMIAGGAPRG